MTNIDEMQMKLKEQRQTLEILVGDDLFGIPSDSSMIKNNYLEPMKEKISGYSVYITYAENPREVVQEALTGKYDVIVTDLDYATTGRVGTEGFEVINEIAKTQLVKKPFVILCTSSDNQNEAIQRQVNEKKIDAVVGVKSLNKFTSLVDYLVKKYSVNLNTSEMRHREK